MKLKFPLLASAVLASSLSLSAQVAHPPVPDGSVSSRAPLPANRPFEYVQVTTDTAYGTQPAQSTPIASHIGGPTAGEAVVVGEPGDPAATATPADQDIVPTTTSTDTVLTPTGRTSLGAGATLDATELGSQIRSDATASREQLLEIEAHVAANDKAMATKRGMTTALSEDDQTKLNSADNDVKETEQALRKSIEAARTDNREQVAADFEAYTAAVARVDALASAQP